MIKAKRVLFSQLQIKPYVFNSTNVFHEKKCALYNVYCIIVYFSDLFFLLWECLNSLVRFLSLFLVNRIQN